MEVTVYDYSRNARILLEDGTEFEGFAFGHESSAAGEVLFYSGQADIGRLLLDPSLKDAILVLTQPICGSTGIRDAGVCPFGLETGTEHPTITIKGLVVGDYQAPEVFPPQEKALTRWLRKYQVPGISGIDTRALIKKIEQRGVMRAKIIIDDTRDVSFSSAGKHSHPQYISVKKRQTYGTGRKKIIAIDCGIKHSALRKLITPDTTVIKTPWNDDFRGEDFDGVFISGGPGDPTSWDKPIAIIKDLLKGDRAIFATGQGAVILALAAGGATYRLGKGHHGSSIPCIDLQTGKCIITAQNHSYGIREDSLPHEWETTFLENNSHCIEGIRTRKGLFSGVLFHPEGNPGPSDAAWLYDDFLKIVIEGGILK